MSAPITYVKDPQGPHLHSQQHEELPYEAEGAHDAHWDRGQGKDPSQRFVSDTLAMEILTLDTAGVRARAQGQQREEAAQVRRSRAPTGTAARARTPDDGTLQRPWLWKPQP